MTALGEALAPNKGKLKPNIVLISDLYQTKYGEVEAKQCTNFIQMGSWIIPSLMTNLKIGHFGWRRPSENIKIYGKDWKRSFHGGLTFYNLMYFVFYEKAEDSISMRYRMTDTHRYRPSFLSPPTYFQPDLSNIWISMTKTEDAGSLH